MNFKCKRALILSMFFLVCLFLQNTIMVKAEEISSLKVVVSTDKKNYNEGEEIKYNIIISNNTSNDAKNVIVTNTLPSELNIIDTSAKINDDKLIWNIDSIPSSEQLSLSFTANVKEQGVNPPEVKTSVEENNTISKSGNSNKMYIYLFSVVIAIIIFIFLFKINKKKNRRQISLMLAFLLVSSTFTTVKAEQIKEITKETHKLVINDKEYVNEFTVEGTIDKDKRILLKADRTFGVPKLEWDRKEGVTYEIKRGETKESIEIPVESVSKNKFVDFDGDKDKSYYYQAIARKDGKEIERSEPVYVKAFIDTDKDGLSDEEEENIYKTDPNNADTDGDKLNDGQEVYVYHTNPLLKDTDGDRLSDFEEAVLIGTSPLNKDTDENGVTDDLEDSDKDKVNNFDEVSMGSNPNLVDSDFDGLTDDKELVYKTNPSNPDTDGDGFNDGNEIKYGTDPLNADSDGNGVKDGQEVFTSNVSVNLLEEDEKVKPFIEVNLEGKNVGTVTITNVEKDNPYLNKDIPGYIGAPFKVSSKEKFDEAKITFNVEKSLLNNENITPSIYSFDEKTKLLELLPYQKVDDSKGTITTNAKNVSTYIVLDKKSVDETWAKEMKAPLSSEKARKVKEDKNYKENKDAESKDTLDKNEQDMIDLATDSDGDGLSDYHEKKGIRVNNGFINGSESYAKIKLDPYNPDVDGDGVKDGEEVTYVDGYFLMKSDPTKADSDNDGIKDGIDPEPMVYSITDRTLSLAAGLSYKNLSSKVGELVGGDKELKEWKIVYGNDSGQSFIKEFSDGGLGSVTIKISRSGKKDAVIFALRGTEPESDSVHDFSADLWMGLATNSRQSNNAFNEYKKLINEFPNAEFYLSGHSLGGRLVQNVLYNTYDSNEGMFGFFKTNLKIPTHSATFNALGYNKVNHWMIKNSIINSVKDKLNNYYFKYDLVGQGFGASKVFKRIGTDIGPLIAKDEKGNPLKFEKISSMMPYSFSELHAIDIFYNEESLKYTNNKSIY